MTLNEIEADEIETIGAASAKHVGRGSRVEFPTQPIIDESTMAAHLAA